MTTLPSTPLSAPDVVVEPNVFKQIRQKHNFSLEDLARRVRVSKQALIRLEQGTFSRPLPSVLEWWVDNYGYSYVTLTDAYEGYRINQRKSNHLVLGPSLAFDIERNVHPLRQLRITTDREVNPSELAKAICVPQATIQHFERKWKTQQSVPKELFVALSESGYTRLQLSEFCKSYVLWRKRMLNHD